MGDCLLWVLFLKIAKISHILGYFFHCQGYALFLTKIYWATFWAFFSSGHPGVVQHKI
jgi:hypothetical protein